MTHFRIMGILIDYRLIYIAMYIFSSSKIQGIRSIGEGRIIQATYIRCLSFSFQDYRQRKTFSIDPVFLQSLLSYTNMS